MATNETNTGATGATTTTTKKAPARLKEPMSDRKAYAALAPDVKANFMDDAEQAAFEALTEGKRREYGLRLQRQKADEELREIRAAEDVERKARKAASDKEKGIKQIITDIRKEEMQLRKDEPLSGNLAIKNQLTALGIPETEQEAVFTRIKTDATKAPSSSRLLPAKPTYALVHTLLMLAKTAFVVPTDGGRPDIALANNVRKFNMIKPVLVGAPNAEGLYPILDGKRRYFLMEDAEEAKDAILYPAVLVEGFPDEATQEKAEVIVNRVRNLNVLATAETLNRMKQRGVEDTEIRRDLGFKTGEVDKIISITDLGVEFQDALKDGSVTPAVALAIAKLPKALRAELIKDYKLRKKENASARISEANVAEIRQARATDAVKRDAPTLAGIAENTPTVEADAPGLDKPKEKAVDSGKSAAPKGAKKGK